MFFFCETVEITYTLLVALYPQKLALTSPTSCGRSVGIVRSRTKVTEFVFLAYRVLPYAYVFFFVFRDRNVISWERHCQDYFRGWSAGRSPPLPTRGWIMSGLLSLTAPMITGPCFKGRDFMQLQINDRHEVPEADLHVIGVAHLLHSLPNMHSEVST
jgi:hypothetical protein